MGTWDDRTVENMRSPVPEGRGGIDRRRFLTALAMGAGVGPLVAKTNILASMLGEQLPQAPSNVRVLARTLLTPSDFTYLGCMRMPAETWNSVGDLSSSYASLGGRKVNGAVQLFMTGSNVPNTGGSQNGQDDVFEFLDTQSYNLDYSTAPRAQLLTAWGNIYQNKRVSWDANGNLVSLQYLLTPCLAWHNNRLYWTYYDSYNVAGHDDWCIGMTDLRASPSQMIAYGPWRPTTPGAGPGVKHAAGWLVEMPDGSLGVGSPGQSGPYASWGPELVSGAPWPTDTTPGGYGATNITFARTHVQYKIMQGYINLDGSLPAGQPIWSSRRAGDYVFHNTNISVGYAQSPTEINPTLNGGAGSFSQIDVVRGCVYINTPTKTGILFVGSMGTGHIWYGPVSDCGHGLGNPCGGGQGPNSSGSKAQWWIYDPAVCQQVVTGQIAPYAIEPSAAFDPTATISSRIKMGCAHRFGGVYFDPETQKLYVAAYQADDSVAGLAWPLVHVFHVS